MELREANVGDHNREEYRRHKDARRVDDARWLERVKPLIHVCEEGNPYCDCNAPVLFCCQAAE